MSDLCEDGYPHEWEGHELDWSAGPICKHCGTTQSEVANTPLSGKIKEEKR